MENNYSFQMGNIHKVTKDILVNFLNLESQIHWKWLLTEGSPIPKSNKIYLHRNKKKNISIHF